MSDKKPLRQKSLMDKFFKIQPSKPGEVYGVPDQGDSLLISTLSAAFIIARDLQQVRAGRYRGIFKLHFT